MIQISISYTCDLGDGITASLTPTLNAGDTLVIPTPANWQRAILSVGGVDQKLLICPNHSGHTFAVEDATPIEIMPVPDPLPVSGISTPVLQGPS